MFEKLYSPEQKIKLSGEGEIFVKRDDLIDPYISGNKWRKLKYLIQKASNEHKNHLVTFGGAYSNHLVAIAAAAARSGLKATAFVRGEEVKNEMLLLCRLFGMELIFVSRERYINKTELYQDLFGNHTNTFFIDEGGASLEAVRGCSEIIDELDTPYNHIFCAAGTGTTAAGLLSGILRKQLHTQLHVVPVLKGASFIESEIVKYTSVSAQLTVHLEYHFGGYAKTTPQLIDFIKNFTAQTGLLLDPVYTGKLFFAIDDLIKKGSIQTNEKILALHSGGLLGIFGMQDKF